MKLAVAGTLLAVLLLLGCAGQAAPQSGEEQQAPPIAQEQQPPSAPQEAVAPPIPSPPTERESKIPSDAVKMAPETDATPPQMQSAEWETPVPLPVPINTAGAEDSPFITPDGNTLYFFFTPDVRVPVEKQLLDGVTGIYVAEKQPDGNWGKPGRVILQDTGKLSLDGCEFVQGNKMWFCSAREGYEGLHWFTAEFDGSKWGNWQNADFPASYEVGELHISADGNELYYHSARKGGRGGLDIWMSSKQADGSGGEPQNLEAVNTERDEGWPYLSQDGNELWFLHDYGTWRSKKAEGVWQAPELIVSSLAGEPTLDAEGNLYFVHHYFEGDRMIEADIYVARKK